MVIFIDEQQSKTRPRKGREKPKRKILKRSPQTRIQNKRKFNKKKKYRNAVDISTLRLFQRKKKSKRKPLNL